MICYKEQGLPSTYHEKVADNKWKINNYLIKIKTTMIIYMHLHELCTKLNQLEEDRSVFNYNCRLTERNWLSPWY